MQLLDEQFKNLSLIKAEAVRNTQLAFLMDYPPSIDYRRPAHWAAFILVGNWFSLKIYCHK